MSLVANQYSRWYVSPRSDPLANDRVSEFTKASTDILLERLNNLTVSDRLLNDDTVLSVVNDTIAVETVATDTSTSAIVASSLNVSGVVTFNNTLNLVDGTIRTDTLMTLSAPIVLIESGTLRFPYQHSFTLNDGGVISQYMLPQTPIGGSDTICVLNGVQILSNKTLINVTISSPAISGGTVATSTITDPTLSGGTISGCAISGGTVATSTITDPTLSGGTITNTNINTPSIYADSSVVRTRRNTFTILLDTTHYSLLAIGDLYTLKINDGSNVIETLTYQLIFQSYYILLVSSYTGTPINRQFRIRDAGHFSVTHVRHGEVFRCEINGGISVDVAVYNGENIESVTFLYVGSD